MRGASPRMTMAHHRGLISPSLRGALAPKQSSLRARYIRSGLLRFARNDGVTEIQAETQRNEQTRFLINIRGEHTMPRFITIGYGDQAGYDRTPEAVRQAAHDHDASLRKRGVVMGIAGTPVQVRNPDDTGVQAKDGPFLSADLPVAGFAIMEAKDINEAIALAAKSPCAVAHGVIEVWPLDDAPAGAT
jgi:hypothetical protein